MIYEDRLPSVPSEHKKCSNVQNMKYIVKYFPDLYLTIEEGLILSQN